MDTKKVSIKLLIDTKKSKVLFAEAGKDFVDFLFFLMGLPMGTIIRLLNKNSVRGSIGNIYESIENLNNKYLQPNQNKDSLLNPMLSPAYSPKGLFLSLEASYDNSVKRQYFECPNHIFSSYVSDDSRSRCPLCLKLMTKEVKYVAYVDSQTLVSTHNSEGGFVNGVATYMVMDDLVIEPMSGISSINLLKNKFGVKEFDYLQEEVVHLDMAKGLMLLKSSLHTKNVLTTVFL